MKILLSAFACAPNRGSEPGVGWNWAMNLSKYHEVWVVTRKQNKLEIDEYTKENKLPFKVIYFGIDTFENMGKIPFKENLYTYFWQKKVLNYVKEVHNIEKFDVFHHITYASFKYPTRLYKLNVPLVVGPVGGGEITPVACKDKFTLKGTIIERIHDYQIKLCKYSISINNMYKYASKILVTTEDTLMCVPEIYREKCEIMQTIGVSSSEVLPYNGDIPYYTGGKFKLTLVGQLKLLKGFRLLVDIAYKLNKEYYDMFEFDIIGEGPDRETIEKWIVRHGVTHMFNLKGNMSRNEVLDNLTQTQLFIFTSFHDSGAMAVLEAMAKRIPVLILDTGGPKVNVSHDTGFKVDPNQDYSSIVDDFVSKIVAIRNQYLNEPKKILDKVNNATEFILDTAVWDKKVNKINQIYNEVTVCSKISE